MKSNFKALKLWSAEANKVFLLVVNRVKPAAGSPSNQVERRRVRISSFILSGGRRSIVIINRRRRLRSLRALRFAEALKPTDGGGDPFLTNRLRHSERMSFVSLFYSESSWTVKWKAWQSAGFPLITWMFVSRGCLLCTEPYSCHIHHVVRLVSIPALINMQRWN